MRVTTMLRCALSALLTVLVSAGPYPECVWVAHTFAAHIQPLGWRGGVMSLSECMAVCYRQACDIFKYDTHTYDCWLATRSHTDPEGDYFVPGNPEEICGDRECVQSVGGDASRAHMENQFERMSQMMNSLMSRNAQGDMQDSWMDEFFSNFFAGADTFYDGTQDTGPHPPPGPHTHTQGDSHTHTQGDPHTHTQGDTHTHTQRDTNKQGASRTQAQRKSARTPRTQNTHTNTNTNPHTYTHTKAPNVLQIMSDGKRKPASNTHTQTQPTHKLTHTQSDRSDGSDTDTHRDTHKDTHEDTHEDTHKDTRTNEFEWNAMKCTKLCSDDGAQCSMQCQ